MSDPILETQVARLAEALTHIAKVTNQLNKTDKQNKTEYTLLFEQLQSSLNAIDLSEVIDDTKSTSRAQTYSIDQIHLLLKQSKDEILGGDIPDALNTLKELIAEISENEQGLAAVLSSQAKRVAVDQVQSFTLAEQQRARANISAVSQSELQQFKDKIGDTDFDFKAHVIGVIESGDVPE